MFFRGCTFKSKCFRHLFFVLINEEFMIHVITYFGGSFCHSTSQRRSTKLAFLKGFFKKSWICNTYNKHFCSQLNCRDLISGCVFDEVWMLNMGFNGVFQLIKTNLSKETSNQSTFFLSFERVNKYSIIQTSSKLHRLLFTALTTVHQVGCVSTHFTWSKDVSDWWTFLKHNFCHKKQ